MGFWTKSISLFLAIRCICAVETNRTIDNKFGDSVTGQKPLFLPPGSVWQGDECLGCPFQADRSRAFNGTWNAATFIPVAEGGKPLSVTFPFQGLSLLTRQSISTCFVNRHGHIYFLHHRKPNPRWNRHNSCGV